MKFSEACPVHLTQFKFLTISFSKMFGNTGSFLILIILKMQAVKLIVQNCACSFAK